MFANIAKPQGRHLSTPDSLLKTLWHKMRVGSLTESCSWSEYPVDRYRSCCWFIDQISCRWSSASLSYHIGAIRCARIYQLILLKSTGGVAFQDVWRCLQTLKDQIFQRQILFWKHSGTIWGWELGKNGMKRSLTESCRCIDYLVDRYQSCCWFIGSNIL